MTAQLMTAEQLGEFLTAMLDLSCLRIGIDMDILPVREESK